jgi:3-oxoacyl-[acyl-carrier protein] reductase
MAATPIMGQHKPLSPYYTRYLGQDLGPFGITANCIAPGVIATGRIMAMVIPGSVQRNRDRAELAALRRLGTVEGLCQSRRVPCDRSVRLCDGGVIPIDGGLVRG